MRTGISITLKPADRRRLKALARDRNSPHKHVWRAEIVLLSADGIGTNEIMRRTGKSKTCVWRWQERFMEAGYEGLSVFLCEAGCPSRVHESLVEHDGELRLRLGPLARRSFPFSGGVVQNQI